MTKRVTVLHAGALTQLVRRGLTPALLETEGMEVISVPGHSVALAKGILAGSLEGDVYLSADANVNGLLSGPAGGDLVEWFLVFARNAIVIAYGKSGPFAAAFERVARGEQHYGVPGLKRRVLGDDVNPGQVGGASFTALAAGGIDAMFLYRSAAIGGPFGVVDLPGAINLGDEAFASSYAGVHFRTVDGYEVRGAPISLSATALRSARNPVAALRFVDFLASPGGQEIVHAFHFTPSPILAGGSSDRLPAHLTHRISGTYRGSP